MKKTGEVITTLSHELWVAAQLLPGEGIEDGVARIEALLKDRVSASDEVIRGILNTKLLKSSK